MRPRRRASGWIAATLAAGFLAMPPAAAAPPDETVARGPGPALFAPVLTAEADVLLLPAGARPPPRPVVHAATRTTATAEAVAAVALDPKAMQRALPSLVRAEVVATRPGPRRDAWPDRLIAWELEIPLFNLSGKAWLQQRDNAVELVLVEGAFAPAAVRIHLGARSAGATAISCALQLSVRNSNFIFRRVAGHDPWAESAMTAATAWVLLRAIVLGAEASGAPEPRRPTGPLVPPAATTLEGGALAGPAFAALRALGTVATIRRGAGGRLAWASAAVTLAAPPAEAAARLAAPESWRAFPGWGKVTRLAAAPPSAGGAPAPIRIRVEDNIALVDLDAVWSVSAAPRTRATVVEGDTRGAVLGWDVHPAAHPGAAIAVLSMHPRLDTAGFVERRLIAAEPLLEHALAAALTYVDAAAMAAAFAAPKR